MAACAGPSNSDERAGVGSCELGDVTAVCSAAPHAITATAAARDAPALAIDTTYAISGPAPGVRGYVAIIPATTGTYTLYFGTGEPIRVCDLVATCTATVTGCPTLHHAAQYAMVAGLRYEIELRPLAPAHPFLLHVVPPATSSAADIVFAAGDLYKVHADGSGLVRLTDTPADELYPSWSPAHDQIAFVRDFQLFVIDSDGTNERLVAPAAGRQRNPFQKTVGPAAWSPDGSRLAYPYPRPPMIIDMGGGELVDESYATTIHLVNADGTNDGELPNAPDRTLNSIGWASNNTISFSEADDCPDCAGGSRYAVIQPDGSGYLEIEHLYPFEDPNQQLDWSSDSSRWVYVGGSDYSDYESVNGAIYTSSAFVTDHVRLLPFDGPWNPRWSADDTQVAYIGGDGIHIVNADGSGDHLVHAVTNVHGIDW